MEKPPVEWQIDTLFGIVEGMQVALTALIRAHPDKDFLEGHFDVAAQPARATVVGSDRTDLALAAFDATLAEFKAVILGEDIGYAGVAWHEAAALRKRLTGG
jgi:hypothetical protein